MLALPTLFSDKPMTWSFLSDPGPTVRFIVGNAAFILSEKYVDSGLRSKLLQCNRAPLIARSSQGKAMVTLNIALKKRGSGNAELFCLLLGITAIDLTKVDTGDCLNHGKFAESPDIVPLIGQRLINGQTLTDTLISLGEGVVAVVGGTVRTVGNLAGTAAAAPLTITDRRERRPTTPDISETFNHGDNPVLLK